jgi:amino acid transporter
MLMAHHGLAHARFSKTHARKQTPGAAGLLAGLVAFLPVALLSWRGVSPADIYGWMGTLSVYGFLTIYGLVAIALPIHLKRHGRLNAAGIALAVTTTLAMALAMAGNILPLPDPPIRYFPLIYLVYLAGGTLWYFASPRRRALVGSA